MPTLNIWELPDNTEVVYIDVEGNRVTGRLVENYGSYFEFVPKDEDASMMIMHDVVDTVVKVSAIKTVSFDFIMDSFVSIQAPEGTDPDTLIEKAMIAFHDLLAANQADVIFDSTIPTSENTDPYGNKL